MSRETNRKSQKFFCTIVKKCSKHSNDVRQNIINATCFHFQSQNILDLLDVSPSPVIPTATPSEPPKTGAVDLLNLLDDVATITTPTVPPVQAPVTGNLMDGLIGSPAVSNNLMNGSSGKLAC